MSSEVAAALIGGAAGLMTSLVTLLLENKGRQAQIRKLNAEAEKLREETETLRQRPAELERESLRKQLSEFLVPFRDRIGDNQRIYDSLLEGRGALEYHPRTLAQFFGSLPYDDRRRLYWGKRIERLRENNRQILSLVIKHGGGILTEAFRRSCADFRYHADEWEDVWRAVGNTVPWNLGEGTAADAEPIPGERVIGEFRLEGATLYANRFPEALPKAVEEEIAEIRSRMDG